MSELFKYIQHYSLTDWEFHELNNVSCLADPTLTCTLIPIGKFDEVFLREKGERHIYAKEHLETLIELLDSLGIEDFEITKQDSKPLTLKTDFFYISIAPRIYLEENEDSGEEESEF